MRLLPDFAAFIINGGPPHDNGARRNFFVRQSKIPCGPAAAGVDPLMPWLLSFAAGAMLYVVVEELIPQAHSRAGTCGFVMGFLVMMVLDVALGG